MQTEALKRTNENKEIDQHNTIQIFLQCYHLICEMKTGCFTKKILKNVDTSNILHTERVDDVNCLSLYYNQQEIFFIRKLSFDAVGSIFLYQHVKINLWLLTINSQSDNINNHFFQLEKLLLDF